VPCAKLKSTPVYDYERQFAPVAIIAPGIIYVSDEKEREREREASFVHREFRVLIQHFDIRPSSVSSIAIVYACRMMFLFSLINASQMDIRKTVAMCHTR